MNRADFSMALGQANQLGDTLLQNRVMQQQKQEREADRGLRERMFTEQQETRRDANKATADYRTASLKNSSLANTLKEMGDFTARLQKSFADIGSNAHSMTESGQDGNAWARQQIQEALDAAPEQLKGELSKQFKTYLDPSFDWVSKGAPKQVGESLNAAGMGQKRLSELQDAVAAAKTDAEKSKATRDLENFERFSPDKTKKTSDPEAGYPDSVKEWMKEIQKAQAQAIIKKDFPEAERLGASIDATRKKWGTGADKPATPQQPPPASVAPQDGVKVVTDQASYDAIPSGQNYKDAQGNIRRKK